jgi:hypothetical protein
MSASNPLRCPRRHTGPADRTAWLLTVLARLTVLPWLLTVLARLTIRRCVLTGLFVAAGLPVLALLWVRLRVVLSGLLVCLRGLLILLRRLVSRLLRVLGVLLLLLRVVGRWLPLRRGCGRLAARRLLLPRLIGRRIARRLLRRLVRLLAGPLLRRVRSLRSAHFTP